MNYNFLSIRLAVFFAMVCLCSCSSFPKVERVDIDQKIDISGRWNDVDSQKVAAAMIADCLISPWINRYSSSREGKNPDIIIGTVVNRSYEHINIQAFIKEIEKALIKSDRVYFVASGEERKDIRKERKDMAVNSSIESFKGPGNEAGADYVLKGHINSIIDEAEGKKVIYYQINLDLIDMNTNRKTWIGEVKIKKFIKRPKYKW